MSQNLSATQLRENGPLASQISTGIKEAAFNTFNIYQLLLYTFAALLEWISWDSHTAWAYLNLSVISSTSKATRGIFSSCKWILVSCRLFPSNSPSSPDRWQMLVLNSWMKRGTVTATCLAQEFNPIIHPRPKPRGYWMKFSPFQYYLDSTTILTINTYILQHQYIYSPY